MRASESRILLYLQNAQIIYCYSGRMSRKLEIDNSYLFVLLSNMVEKGWIRREKPPRGCKIYYILNKAAPLADARKKLEED